MVGKSLSHYKILEEFGRGGMGIVYKARDTKLDRVVAVKVLPSAALTNENDRARFYREAKAAAQLNHANIASVYEIDEAVPEGSGSDDVRPFIAMEFIDGQTLHERIEKGPLKLDEVVRIAGEIADALQAAHEQHIVHRDIKSANVMLTGKRLAKVLDFGLAQTAASTKLTRVGSTLGTIAYMSPEQARGEEVDLRTDLWSLGVVMYEMLSGRAPFPGDYEQAVVYEIINQAPEPLTAIRTGIPVELERIVFKCLSKDAKKRYQHADDLIADLAGVVTGEGTRAPFGSRTPALGSKRFPTAWLLVAGVIMGAAVTQLISLILGSGSGGELPQIESWNRVTIESVVEMWPSIHPDGDQIVYAAGEIDNMRLQYRLVEGGPPHRLIDGLEVHQTHPTYSPDGNQVLFAAEGTIYTVESLGGAPRPVARPVGAELFSFPAWSPLGNEIVFTTTEDSIIVQNIATRERRLATYFKDPHSPSWSPDGELIAFVTINRTQADNGENVGPTALWLLRSSDGELIQVTSHEHMEMSPTWSADGRYLYYVSNRGGGINIYRQSIRGSGRVIDSAERITTGLNLHSITMALDGSRIVGGVLRYYQNL